MESEEKKTGCSGRCEHCNLNQRTYCAAQMAYYAQQEIAEIKTALAAMGQKREDDSIVVLRDEEELAEEEMEEV